MGLRAHNGCRFFSQPEFSDVPFAEYRSRIDRAQKLMAEIGIDCQLLWSRPNVRYGDKVIWGCRMIGTGLNIHKPPSIDASNDMVLRREWCFRLSTGLISALRSMAGSAKWETKTPLS